ncbi:hypothetical protein SLS62_005825 [Diatrype stigma]|uniref:Uncharacterized protein n=1 Tax=Diatrype stigma TaxID=117547 RepID=A0AAN9UNN3_9PEZI
MQLFDLPPELVHKVFQSIVLSRDLTRVMRMRFVNRHFKEYIDAAILALRLLSNVTDSARQLGQRLWPAWDSNEDWVSYVYNYLASQALEEGPNESSLGRVYRVAQALCEQDGDTKRETLQAHLKSLVRLAARDTAWFFVGSPTSTMNNYTDPELKADICVAAIYLGRKSYVEQSIAQSIMHRPINGSAHVPSRLFGDAFGVAMLQGDLDMIKLVLSRTGEYTEGGTIATLSQLKVLTSTSDHGHRAAFDFAFDMEPFNSPTEGQSRVTYRTTSTLENVLSSTRWPAVYDRVAEILGPRSEPFDKPEKNLSDGLDRSAAKGRLEMVRHFLDKGVSPDAKFDRDHQPLLSAIRGGDARIVSMLLDAGADPNLHLPAPHTSLTEAAWKRNVALAKLLLDRGADVDKGRPAPVVVAVFKEDLGMFRLLREHGARLDTPETGGSAMALAKLHGLSSMVELLVGEGVGEDVVLHDVASKGEDLWHRRFWPRWALAPRLARYCL